jgi:hypothetical protein
MAGHGNRAPAVLSARQPRAQGEQLRALGDQLEREVGHAAAALAEGRTERKALQAFDAVRIVQHRAGDRAGAQLEMAAADGVELQPPRVTAIAAPASRGPEPSTSATVTSTAGSSVSHSPRSQAGIIRRLLAPAHARA